MHKYASCNSLIRYTNKNPSKGCLSQNVNLRKTLDKMPLAVYNRTAKRSLSPFAKAR